MKRATFDLGLRERSALAELGLDINVVKTRAISL